MPAAHPPRPHTLHARTPQPSQPTRSVADPLRQMTAPVRRWQADMMRLEADELVAEEPLELRVRAPEGMQSAGMQSAGMQSAGASETLAVIMRTPGHDEELAAGFLYCEGLIRDYRELAAMRAGLDADGLPSPNTLEIIPAAGVDLLARLRANGYSRQFAVNASCGVCGKNTVAAACAAFPPVPLANFQIAPKTLYRLPDRLRAGQRVFSATGGLHAAGLFDSEGALRSLREDIGRHNAVDKLIGEALLAGALPCHEQMLLVSGRLSYEIVLKVIAAGIPLVAAVSAPSSLAVELAEAGGVTLVAFLRGAGMNVYTHPARIRVAASS